MNATKSLGMLRILCLFLPSLMYSQDLSHLTLIAHYPLTSTANDTTGNYGPMTLVNTPFQDNGIYCNGNAEFCNATTPIISGLNFEAFAVSAKFKVASDFSTGCPLFICGNGWRWMGVWLTSDSSLGYIYNYSAINYTSLKFSLDAWHLATVVYDSSKGIGKYYIDGVLADSARFQLEHGNEKTFTVSHSGYGNVFKGIFSDLKIYTKKEETDIESDKSSTAKFFHLDQNYPNPFNPSTIISYSLPKSDFVTLTVYNSNGREIQTLVSQNQIADKYNINFDAHDLSSGIYFYKLIIGNEHVETKKMLLIR